MHDTAFRIGKLAMNIYADLASASVLEIGSLAVNGALRDHALPTTNFVGMDIERGEGVDIVAEPGEPFPVEDGAFDLVMASSVFEHDPMFWVTFVEMCRKTREGGYIYISAPSNGVVHRFPQDNWRFYPDAAQALVKWAIAQGQHVSLMESFTAAREGDMWNDFVAIFRKGRIVTKMPTVFVHDHVPCWNVTTWQSKDTINPRDEPEDMALISEARIREGATEQARAAAVEAHSEALRQAAELNERHESLTAKIADTDQELQARLSELQTSRDNFVAQTAELVQKQELLDAVQRQLEEREAAYEQRSAELDSVRADLSLRESELRQLEEREAAYERRSAELDSVRADLSLRESELRQRQEEIEQTRAELAKARSEREEIAIQSAQERSTAAAHLVEVEAATVRHLSEAKSKVEGAESRARMLQQDLEIRFNEIARLTLLLRQQEEQAQTVQTGLKQQAETRLSEIVRLELHVRGLEQQVETRLSDIVKLTAFLDQQEQKAALAVDNENWLQSVMERLMSHPRWWRLLPQRWQSRREHKSLKRSGLFDEVAYLEQYPDVRKSGMSPIRHYILHGRLEGRSRSF